MSGPNQKKRLLPSNSYWDTCLFLAWLKNESRPKQEMDELAREQTLFDEGKIHLTTSVITLVEVLECTLEEASRRKFQEVLERDNFHLHQVTSQIARKAHDIRNAFSLRNAIDSNGTFSTPDAIHLATAILSGCDYFLTFDGSSGKPKKGPVRAILPAASELKAQFDLEVRRPWLDPDPSKNLELELFTDSSEGIGQSADAINGEQDIDDEAEEDAELEGTQHQEEAASPAGDSVEEK